jgi:hypothetical protein
MSEEKKDQYVKRSCTKSPKRYADVLNSEDESYMYDQDSSELGEAAKTASPQIFIGFSEIRTENPLVGYDGHSRAICVALIGADRGAIEYSWIPLDALRNDAKHHPYFLSKIEEFAAKEDKLFWPNQSHYIAAADQRMWELPRSSVINWHSTIVKDPFIAMALPTPECNECIVFFKLSCRKYNGGTTYSSLKVLVEGLMVGGQYAIARNLLKFARNHTDAIHHFIASGDEIKIQKFFGFSIILDDLAQKTIVPFSTQVKTSAEKRLFLESFNPNYAKDVLRPLAEKYLGSKSYDMELFRWYKSADTAAGDTAASYAGAMLQATKKNDSWFEGMLLKMEVVIDKLSSTTTKSSSQPISMEEETADIEASDVPFNYEGKRVNFEAECAGCGSSPSLPQIKTKKAKKRDDTIGLIPLDMEREEDFPKAYAGKKIKFFTSQAASRPNLDALLMAASMISREEETQNNTPFALGGYQQLPYKKRNWSRGDMD